MALIEPVPIPYHHDKFYASMFSDNEKSPSQVDCHEEDSFLGARMQFPEALVRHQSHPGPISSSQSCEKKQQAKPKSFPSKTRNSVNPRRSTSANENRKSKSRNLQRKQITPEEIQIQQLYLEATRHQAATARVVNLEDFQTMTFTLPAAKTSSTMTSNQHTEIRIFSPLKQCPFLPVLTPSSRNNQGRKSGGSMFRGKKTWTSSAAAGSFIAEAIQADRYYYRPSKRQSDRSQRSKASPPFMDHIEEGEENKERRWTSLLPKKWTAHR
jgi:hypothetical protein